MPSRRHAISSAGELMPSLTAASCMNRNPATMMCAGQLVAACSI